VLADVNNPMTIIKPSTVYVKFTHEVPGLFLLMYATPEKDRNGNLVNDTYYFRYLNRNTPRIKFNIPDPGSYIPSVPVEIVKIVDIEIPENYPRLPPANRDRWQEVKYWYNPQMDSVTPIRIYSHTGVIEYGDRFLSFIKPIQVFLEQHEKGHMFYLDEEDCDLFALVNTLRMGYNQSTCYYAMSHVLSRTKQNIERIQTLFNNIQKIRNL